MGRRSQHRKDGPHDAIREACERLGYLWLDTAQTGLGFDALVVKHGQFRVLEIKDGSKPPSARKLTPHEERVHAALKRVGVTVEILTGVDESLEVLSERNRNFYGKEANER